MGKSKIIFFGETLMDLTGDTVAADKMLEGYTAHDSAGEPITGICTFNADTRDASATASEVLRDKTAYLANGEKATGTMPNNGAVNGKITTKNGEYTVPLGFHDGSGKVSIDSTERAKIIPGNILTGVQILGVTGTVEPSSSVSAQAKTATPSKNAQTILPDANYDYLSQVTINAIPYTESLNPQGGYTVTIGA